MRRLVSFVSSLLMAAALVSAVAAPAAAATCFALLDQLKLGEGLYHPVISTKSNVSIEPFDIDGCVGSGMLFTASCSTSSGIVTINGRTLGVTWIGNTITFGAGPGGSAHIEPDAANGESCMSGSGADVFLVTGVIRI